MTEALMKPPGGLFTVITYLGVAAAIIAEFSFTFWLLLKGVEEGGKNEFR